MKIKNKLKFIGILLAIVLIIIGIYFLLSNNPSFILIVFTEIIILSWVFTKGKWEENRNKNEVESWRKSIIFNIYLLLLIIHSILSVYLWINRPPSLSDQPGNFLNTLDFINFFGFVIFINTLSILILILKRAPKQILSLPLLALFISMIPAITANINFEFLGIFIYNYFFAILSGLQLIWLYYIRFIFLKNRK